MGIGSDIAMQVGQHLFTKRVMREEEEKKRGTQEEGQQQGGGGMMGMMGGGGQAGTMGVDQTSGMSNYAKLMGGSMMGSGKFSNQELKQGYRKLKG